MKDGSRHSYSVPDGDPQEIFNQICNSPDIDKREIKSNYFFPETRYNVHDFQYYFDEETKDIDEKPLAIDFKVEEVKKQRGVLFKTLDLEFMKGLEENNQNYVNHITKIKNYLRNLPPMVEDYCQTLNIHEIVTFNAFNNIYSVDIIHKGSGYAKPPTITVDPPNDPNRSGFHTEAIAFVKDNSLSKVTLTRIGSGYINIPSVSVSPPDEEGGELAILRASPPENDIYTIRDLIQKIEDLKKSKE